MQHIAREHHKHGRKNEENARQKWKEDYNYIRETYCHEADKDIEITAKDTLDVPTKFAEIFDR